MLRPSLATKHTLRGGVRPSRRCVWSSKQVPEAILYLFPSFFYTCMFNRRLRSSLEWQDQATTDSSFSRALSLAP